MSKKVIIGLVFIGLIALIAVVNHAGMMNLLVVTIRLPFGLLIVGAMGVIAGLLIR